MPLNVLSSLLKDIPTLLKLLRCLIRDAIVRHVHQEVCVNLGKIVDEGLGDGRHLLDSSGVIELKFYRRSGITRILVVPCNEGESIEVLANIGIGELSICLPIVCGEVSSPSSSYTRARAAVSLAIVGADLAVLRRQACVEMPRGRTRILHHVLHLERARVVHAFVRKIFDGKVALHDLVSTSILCAHESNFLTVVNDLWSR